VNHSKTYKARDGAHTNTIESCWNAKFKSQIGNKFYADADKLQGHLWKQVWKSSVKENLWNEFWKALGATGWTKNDGLHVKIDYDAELAAIIAADPDPTRWAAFNNVGAAANATAHPEANAVVHEYTVVDDAADM
jgi:hypothetical protein